jgi:hypothetical protein
VTGPPGLPGLPGVDPADRLLAAIRELGDGPEPAPTDRLAAFLAERHARRSPPPVAVAEPPLAAPCVVSRRQRVRRRASLVSGALLFTQATLGAKLALAAGLTATGVAAAGLVGGIAPAPHAPPERPAPTASRGVPAVASATATATARPARPTTSTSAAATASPSPETPASSEAGSPSGTATSETAAPPSVLAEPTGVAPKRGREKAARRIAHEKAHGRPGETAEYRRERGSHPGGRVRAPGAESRTGKDRDPRPGAESPGDKDRDPKPGAESPGDKDRDSKPGGESPGGKGRAPRADPKPRDGG